MELNKIAASILLSGLIIMIVSNVVDMLYNPEKYKIEHQTIVAAGSNEPQQKIEQVALDIGALMQSASLERGKSIAKKCIACHSFDKGGANKVGPNLWSIVGNKKHISVTHSITQKQCLKRAESGDMRSYLPS